MRKFLAVLAFVFVAVFALAGPAAAHDELVSSLPADGAVLDKAPVAVVLTFEEAPLAGSSKIVAAAADGTAVPLVEPIVTGSKVSAGWPANTPGGKYTVSWRNVGGDGHPLSGTFSFSYTAQTQSASASTSATTSPPPSPTQTISASPEPTAATASSSTWIWVTLVAILIIGVGTATTFVLRKRSAQ